MSSNELETLLGQNPSRIRARAAVLFNDLVSLGQPLVLFGAGGLGRKTLDGLRKLGRPPVAFAESNPRLHGTEGTELDVLEWVAAHTSAHRPLLALSAYHRQEHLSAVPLPVRPVAGSYDFYLRRHSCEILGELVLYAIPRRR